MASGKSSTVVATGAGLECLSPGLDAFLEHGSLVGLLDPQDLANAKAKAFALKRDVCMTALKRLGVVRGKVDEAEKLVTNMIAEIDKVTSGNGRAHAVSLPKRQTRMLSAPDAQEHGAGNGKSAARFKRKKGALGEKLFTVLRIIGSGNNSTLETNRILGFAKITPVLEAQDLEGQVLATRISVIINELKKKGLVRSLRRGVWQVTANGRKIVESSGGSSSEGNGLGEEEGVNSSNSADSEDQRTGPGPPNARTNHRGEKKNQVLQLVRDAGNEGIQFSDLAALAHCDPILNPNGGTQGAVYQRLSIFVQVLSNEGAIENIGKPRRAIWRATDNGKEALKNNGQTPTTVASKPVSPAPQIVLSEAGRARVVSQKLRTPQNLLQWRELLIGLVTDCAEPPSFEKVCRIAKARAPYHGCDLSAISDDLIQNSLCRAFELDEKKKDPGPALCLKNGVLMLASKKVNGSPVVPSQPPAGHSYTLVETDDHWDDLVWAMVRDGSSDIEEIVRILEIDRQFEDFRIPEPMKEKDIFTHVEAAKDRLIDAGIIEEEDGQLIEVEA